MRLLLAVALLVAMTAFLLPTADAALPGNGDGCTYTHYVDPSTGYVYVRQDCRSGITVCHTEVSGGAGQPFNAYRECAY